MIIFLCSTTPLWWTVRQKVLLSKSPTHCRHPGATRKTFPYASKSTKLSSKTVKQVGAGFVSHGLATQKGKVGDAKGMDMLDGE